ncbi:MAG TPA: hypothetical protein VNX86_04565 [Rhizomicrobium sp.]|nr:hypothetical protein [Rhizomicrobium sp.]
MTQTRAMSAVEACANVAIGFAINFVGQLVLYPVFRIHTSIATNTELALCFTAISIARSYIVRRWFNGPLARLRMREQRLGYRAPVPRSGA